MNDENPTEPVMMDPAMRNDPRYAYLFDGLLGQILDEMDQRQAEREAVHNVNKHTWTHTATRAAAIILPAILATMLLVAWIAAR